MDGAIEISCCTGAPTPTDILERWDIDPLLIGALGAIAFAYFVGAQGIPRREQRLFLIGWCIAALALISPLTALSVSLVSASVAQQMLLALVAAPMMALGRPIDALARFFWISRLGVNPAQTSRTAFPVAMLLAAVLWYWHAPYAFALASTSARAYWAMQAGVFGASLWLWSALLLLPHASPGGGVAAGLFSLAQMGALGALIALSPDQLYASDSSAPAWGLTPIEDQQLGGALLLGAGCLAFLSVTILEMRAMFASPLFPSASAR